MGRCGGDRAARRKLVALHLLLAEVGSIRGDWGRHIPIRNTWYGTKALLRGAVYVLALVGEDGLGRWGWWCVHAGNGCLVGEEVGELARHATQVGSGVLAGESDRRLVEVL